MTSWRPIIADRIYITRGIITRQRGIKLRSTIHLKLSSLIGSTPRIIFRCLCISHPISHFQRPPLFIRRHIPTGRTNSLSLFRNTASHSYTPSIMHSVNLVIRLDTIMQTLIRFIIIYSRTITHMAVINVSTTHILGHPATIVRHWQNCIHIFFIIHHRSVWFSANRRLWINNNSIHRICDIPIVSRSPTYHLIKTGGIKSMRKLRTGSSCHQYTINIPTILNITTPHGSIFHIRYRRLYGFHHHTSVYLPCFQIYGGHGKCRHSILL